MPNVKPMNSKSIVVAVLAGGLWLVGPSAPSVQAQTITFGPNGVRVIPNPPPDDHRDHRHHDRDHGDRYGPDHRYRDYRGYDHDGPWRAVRDRMREFRDECRDGDRGACVRLGIIIGKNQARQEEWRREHPSYFWWDRD